MVERYITKYEVIRSFLLREFSKENIISSYSRSYGYALDSLFINTFGALVSYNRIIAIHIRFPDRSTIFTINRSDTTNYDALVRNTMVSMAEKLGYEIIIAGDISCFNMVVSSYRYGKISKRSDILAEMV